MGIETVFKLDNTSDLGKKEKNSQRHILIFCSIVFCENFPS